MASAITKGLRGVLGLAAKIVTPTLGIVIGLCHHYPKPVAVGPAAGSTVASAITKGLKGVLQLAAGVLTPVKGICSILEKISFVSIVSRAGKACLDGIGAPQACALRSSLAYPVLLGPFPMC